MSADNLLYVRRWRGKYYIEQRFASCDYDERRRPDTTLSPHITAAGAILHAHKLASQGYYEYGVSISRGVEADLNVVRA